MIITTSIEPKNIIEMMETILGLSSLKRNQKANRNNALSLYVWLQVDLQITNAILQRYTLRLKMSRLLIRVTISDLKRSITKSYSNSSSSKSHMKQAIIRRESTMLSNMRKTHRLRRYLKT